MAGRIWTAQEDKELKKFMLGGLAAGEPENRLVVTLSKKVNRTSVAVRLRWQQLRTEDKDTAEAFEVVKKTPAEAEEERETAEADIGREYINIVVSSRRITSVKDAISHFEIDLNEWEIERYKVKTSEGYRKDRKVDWHVTDGKVTKGDVSDSGMMLVVPMYHIQVTLKRKTEEIRTRAIIEDMLKDAARKVPKTARRKYAKLPAGMWYEVDMFDVHFGKETWAEESGTDYNIEIARTVVLSAMLKLLDYAQPHKIEQILLPMGNDFFNVDNKDNTTTHGTPQQEDTRWQRTFTAGRQLAEDMIAMCADIAPVKVLMVPGNHDEQRTYYLGEVLAARYGHEPHVQIEVVNSARKRKYIHFGKNLIGFTHGYWEKVAKLPSIMPIEAPDKWAASIHREFHLGDKHHKKDLLHRTEDMDGVTIRLLRSLSGTDTWHFDKGYVGVPRSAEGFLWDKEDGVVAQFQATHNEGDYRNKSWI